MLNENMEQVIDSIFNNNDLINKLTDEQVTYLIDYLQMEIKNKEELLKKIKENVES